MGVGRGFYHDQKKRALNRLLALAELILTFDSKRMPHIRPRSFRFDLFDEVLSNNQTNGLFSGFLGNCLFDNCLKRFSTFEKYRKIGVSKVARGGLEGGRNASFWLKYGILAV